VWPRRGLRVATSPVFRGHSIGRADGPDRASRGRFTKNPLSFRKSTRAPDVLSEFFTKNTSCYFQINAQSRPDGHWFVCKKDLHFIENQLALPRHSHRFLRKHPQIFLKSKYSPTLIISFVSQKNTCGQWTACMGAPEKLVNRDGATIGREGDYCNCEWMPS